MSAESMVQESSPRASVGVRDEEIWMMKEAKARSRGSRRGRRDRNRSRFDPDEDFDTESDADGGSELRDSSSDGLDEMDASILTEEERLFRSAKRRAEKKIALTRGAVRAGLITIPLLIFLPFAGAIALLYFGVDLGRRAFRLFYEPELRERFLRDEVQRQVVTRVRSERQHLEGEHHRSLEQLSASIAHEIRNPITAAKSLIQQLNEDPASDDRDEYARVALGELERVERSISHLLRFAREEETRVEPIELEDVLESAIETFRDRCARSGVEIERNYDSVGVFDGDPEQLRRVAINLIGNAIDAVEAAPAGAPKIRVAMGENLAGSEVWLRISDNGLGMDEQTRVRIFDPFFTSREEGTGLGLALCRKIVDEHGGRIDVDSQPGEGTEFVISLPKGGRS